MANIEIFLTAATAYGVPQSGLFACNDLYEGKNMPMVIATILQVGSEVSTDFILQFNFYLVKVIQIHA
jgi:hypothetical protein